LNEFGATNKGYLQSAARPCALSAMRAPPPEFHSWCEKIVLNKLWAPNAVSAFGSCLVNFGRTNPTRYAGARARRLSKRPLAEPTYSGAATDLAERTHRV
jgi:hypothetical protein